MSIIIYYYKSKILPMGEKDLKRNLTCLYRAKYNEISIGHSHVEKYVSYKKGIKNTNIMSPGSHISFRCIASYGGKFLKDILTHLYSSRCKEINICHLDVQNYIFCKKWHK